MLKSKMMSVVEFDAIGCGLEFICGLIHNTPKLEELVIRKANSPLYPKIRKIDRISRAVVTIGYHDLISYFTGLVDGDQLAQFEYRNDIRRARSRIKMMNLKKRIINRRK